MKHVIEMVESNEGDHLDMLEMGGCGCFTDYPQECDNE